MRAAGARPTSTWDGLKTHYAQMQASANQTHRERNWTSP